MMNNMITNASFSKENTELLNSMVRIAETRILSANKLLEETQYHQAFVVNGNSMGFADMIEDIPERVTRSVFAACAEFLKKVKVKDPEKAVALVLSSTSGTFKFAAIVQFSENEENPEDPGNWHYSHTFEESVLEDLEKSRSVKKYLFSDDSFKTVLDDAAYNVGSIQFKKDRFLFSACNIVIDTILQVLDKEAVEDEIVEIQYPGYFSATVEVENDKKSFGITPDGAMKEIVKNSDSDVDC